MHLACPACSAVNRVPVERLVDQPICGKCQTQLLPNQAVEVSQTQFQTLVGRGELPVVVDFWASWCGPCQMMAPIFNKVAEQLAGKALFVKVNTESEQQLAAQFGIRSIPTLKVFKSGKVVGDMAGALPEGQLKQWVSQYI